MTSRSSAILAISLIAVVTMVTTAMVAYAETFNRELSIGMSGPDVSALQTFLAQDATIYPQGLITGYFGLLTEVAVSNFQSRHNLPPVGRVGPMTLPVLNQQVAGVVSLGEVNNSSAVTTITTTVTNTQIPTIPNPSPTIPNPTEGADTLGTTTLVVMPIALLSGGVARAGTSVPIAYLQVANTGNEAVFLRGFWVKQNGSASDQSIIGLTTIDDRDNVLGSTGGIEGSMPFTNGSAFVPVNTTFAPGQTRVFTIRAVLSGNAAADLGKQLMIDVTSIDTTVPIKGPLPIRGTTWIIN